MSTANESQVETLHRQMSQASLEAADLGRQLHELRSEGPGLDSALRGWSDSARSLSLAFAGCRGQLIKDGSSSAVVDRISARLDDLVLRSGALDVTRDLDESVRSWQAFAIELGELRGVRREYMFAMAESFQPRIDRSTQLLAQARAEGGINPQLAEQLRTVQAKRDEALRTYEARRLRYIEAEKALREEKLRDASSTRATTGAPLVGARAIALGSGLVLETVAASAARARPGQPTPQVIRLAQDPRKLASTARTASVASPQLAGGISQSISRVPSVASPQLPGGVSQHISLSGGVSQHISRAPSVSSPKLTGGISQHISEHARIQQEKRAEREEKHQEQRKLQQERHEQRVEQKHSNQHVELQNHPAPHVEAKRGGHLEQHRPGSNPTPQPHLERHEAKHGGIEQHHKPAQHEPKLGGSKLTPQAHHEKHEPNKPLHHEQKHQPKSGGEQHRSPSVQVRHESKPAGHIALQHKLAAHPTLRGRVELHARHRRSPAQHPVFAAHPHPSRQIVEEHRRVVEHLETKHAPAQLAPPPRPPVSAPTLKVTRTDRIAAWPLGQDNIGRGLQMASLHFQATGFEAHQPVFGTMRVALGQGVVLSVMPSLSLEHTQSGLMGSLSIAMVSSGGRLGAGADLRAVQAQAKIAVRDAGQAVADRLGAYGRFLNGPVADLLTDGAVKVFERAQPQRVPVHIQPPHRLPHAPHGDGPHPGHPGHPGHIGKHPDQPEHPGHPGHAAQHEGKHPSHHGKRPARHHKQQHGEPLHHAHARRHARHSGAASEGGAEAGGRGSDHASFGISVDLEALLSSHGGAARMLINIDVHIPRMIDAHGQIALGASVDTVAHAMSAAISASAQLSSLGSGDHLTEEQRSRALEAAHTIHAWIQRNHSRIKALTEKSAALHARIGHIVSALGAHHGHLGAAREKLRKGRTAKLGAAKHTPNRHGVTEHHVHQLNAAFAKTLEHARTHGHKSKGKAQFSSMLEAGAERAGVADRLLRTLESLSVANGRALIDPHGGALRTTAAKVDALIGKLRGKAGHELAAGAHEIGGLLSEMSRTAQTAGTAHHLNDFKKLLAERTHELQHVADAVAGKSGAHAIKMPGGLAQPSILAKGEHALEQLRKIHPELEKILKGSSHLQLSKDLAHLTRADVGKLGGLASILKPEAAKLAKGLEGLGTSMLGRLGVGHLGGLGSGHSSGALAAFGSGALGRLAHHVEGELKKNGIKDIGKILHAAEKGGVKGGLQGAMHLLEASQGKKRAAKPAKGAMGTAHSALNLSKALVAGGKHDIAAQLKAGGALHSLVEGAQRSHGSGLGGVTSHLLQKSGNQKLSQAMGLVEGLKKQGHMPRFSLWGAITSRVSSAVSSVSGAVSKTVNAGSNLVKATMTTVSSGISNLEHKAEAGLSSLASTVKKGVGQVAGKIGQGAKALANAGHKAWDKASALGSAAMSAAHKGFGAMEHLAADKLHSAQAWAGQKVGSAWNQIKHGAGEAWNEAKHVGAGAAEWARKNAGKAGSFIGEKVKSGLEYVNKTGIVGALGSGLKKGISFLGKVAQHTPMGALAKKGLDFVEGGGLSKLLASTKSLAGKAWGGLKAGYKAASGFLQSPAGQLLTTGLSLAASFIPGGMLVKGLIGGAVGAIGAMSEGKNWKQVLLSAGSGALTGALPFMKLGPLAKVGIGALQGAGTALMQGGSFKDALKGAAGGALDSFDPGAFTALKKLKSLSSAEKLLKGGKLSEIEKMAGPGGKMLGKLEQVMTNPRIRKTVGALEKAGGKTVKAGIWVSGKAARAQDLLDKAVSMGDKVNGVLGQVQQYAPGVAGFLGDNALGHFVGKVGDYAGAGHEKLDKALEYGHSASDKLSQYRGYLDKGLGYVGVKDPAKAYAKMQKESAKAKSAKSGSHEKLQSAVKANKGESGGGHKSLLSRAIDKGKDLQKKGVAIANKVDHRLEQVHSIVGKGLDGAKKIQSGLEKASELAEKGAEFLGEDSELGHYLMAMHQRADQVHGYLETGIGYADKFNDAIEKGQGYLHKIPGVGHGGDEAEGGEEHASAGKKKSTPHDPGGDSPIARATQLNGKGKKKRIGPAGHAEDARASSSGANVKKPAAHPAAPKTSRTPDAMIGEVGYAVDQLEHLIDGTLKIAQDKIKKGDVDGARETIEHNSELVHKAYDKVNKLEGELHHSMASSSAAQVQLYAGIEGKIYQRSAAAMKKYFDSTNHMPGISHAEVKPGMANPDAVKLAGAIAGLRAKVAAAGTSSNEEHANVSAELQRSYTIKKLTSDAKILLGQVSKLRAKYKGNEAALKIIGDEKQVQDLIDTLSGWKQFKEEQDKKKKEAESKGEGKAIVEGKGTPAAKGKLAAGKNEKHGGMGKSIENGLAAIERYKKKALKAGKKLDANLGKLEKGLGKGIAIGKKVDSGLQQASGLSEQLSSLFGHDSAIGHMADEVHGYADQGHEKLHSALSMAEKGKKGVHKGREVLESVLGLAQKDHEKKEDDEAKEAGKKLGKHLDQHAQQQGEVVRHGHGGRGHPNAPHPHHQGSEHKGHGHAQHGGSHATPEAPKAQTPQADPATLVQKAGVLVQHFTKDVSAAIPQIEKLLHAGRAKDASSRVNAVTITSENARQALVAAVGASAKYPSLHKQAIDLQKHYLEVRGHFFTFVHSLHGLQSDLDAGIDAKKYPDLARLQKDLNDFAAKVSALGDAKSADSKMSAAVKKLEPVGSDLHKKATELLAKYSKDQLGSTYLKTLMDKLADALKLLGGHGDKKAQAKGDKSLGVPSSVNPSVDHTPGKPGQQHGGQQGDDVLAHALNQLGDSGRVFVDKGAHRGESDHGDGQEIDPSQMDTWIGSGEGAKLFSEVFGAFLAPSGGALVIHRAGKAGGGKTSQASGAHGGAAHGGAAHAGGAGASANGSDHGDADSDSDMDGGEEQDHGTGKHARHGKHRRGKARGPHKGGKTGNARKDGKGKSSGGGIFGGLEKMAGGIASKVSHALSGSGFFKQLFDHLQGFADKVSSLAGKGSSLLGKGMHYAEVGEGMLNKVTNLAGKVHDGAGKAESLLDKMGLKKLGSFAGKIGSEAGTVEDKSKQGHDLLNKADHLMGQGKKALGSVGSAASKASGIFATLEKGDFSKALSVFKALRFSDGIDGKLSPDKFRPSNILDSAQRLDGMTRNQMETALGGDFGGVRIHTGPGAAEVTKRYAAEAVTVKDHIFFAPGRFNPASLDGQKLIAHELTHVMQVGRPNLDVRTAETEALTTERTYGNAPTMTPLNLSPAKPDFLMADGMGAGGSGGVFTAKRSRSKGQVNQSMDTMPDGEEMLEAVSNRVYEILLEEMEHSFESR